MTLNECGYENMLKAYSSDSYICLTKKQLAMSREFVDPDMPNIVQTLKNLREMLDSEQLKTRKGLFGNKEAAPNVPGRVSPSDYPMGYCLPITQIMLEKLDEIAGFITLKEKGVPIKRVYGVLNNKYFQNAIQIGEYFVDVANDTAEPTLEKVVVNKLNKVNFRPIYTQEQHSKIDEKYRGVKIVPNFYLPQLSIFFPCFAVYKDSCVMLRDVLPSIALNNFRNNYAGVRKFFLDSKYSKNTLPKKAEGRLKDIVEKTRFKLPDNLKKFAVLCSKNRMDEVFGYLEKGDEKIKDRKELAGQFGLRHYFACEFKSKLTKVTEGCEDFSFDF